MRRFALPSLFPIAIPVSISISLALALTLSATPAQAVVPAQTQPLSNTALGNATYPVPDVPNGEVTLVNGAYSNTDDGVTVQLQPRPRATADLDGDGNPETIVYLVANTGGSGVYSYISVVGNNNGEAQPLDTVFLGDRVDVRLVTVVGDEVRVALRDRLATQPMSARPTVRLTYSYKLLNGKLIASQPLSNDVINNAEYPLDIAVDGDAQFTNGQYADKTNHVTASILPRPRVTGDLNGDGAPDTVVTLVGNAGGSGVFTYIAALVNVNYGPHAVATAAIADRVTLSGISIQNGTISVTYLERQPDEPMVAKPTVPTTKTFALVDGKLVAPGGMSEGAPEGDTSAPATPEPTTSAVPTPAVSVSYTCADGKSFDIVFNGAKATLTLNGTAEALTQQESADGIRYGNANLVLVGKGNDAIIEDPAGNIIARECTASSGDTAGTEVTPTVVAPTTSATTASYTCAAGKSFDVAFTGSSATVTFEGKAEVLTQQESADGIRYGNENLVLVGKGNDAILEDQYGKLLADACVAAPQPTATSVAAASPINVSFTCADGQTFDVVYEGSKATVTISGTTEVLDQKLSGSGFRYGNDKITLVGKGNEALITDAAGNTVAGDCSVSPAAPAATVVATPAPTSTPAMTATATSTTTTTDASPIEASYTCADGQKFDIVYANKTATVTISGTEQVLPQLLSGSGFRYGNDQYTLSGKGNEIMIVDAQDKSIASDCTVTETPSSVGEAVVPTTTVTTPVTSTNPLIGSWTATKLGQEDLTAVKLSKPVTLKFEADRISANAGCNGMGGSYQTNGNRLTFGPIISTLMACPEPGVMERESLFGQILQETQSYSLTSTSLSLLNSDGVSMAEFMRIVTVTAATTGTMTGTTTGTTTATTPAKDVALSGVLTGVVTYRQRIALPDNAVVVVKLQDTSLADAPATDIATQTIETKGSQVPIPFELTYDPGKINSRMRYTISVRITVGDRLMWINTTSVPVLTSNAPKTDVTVIVSPV